MASEAGSQLITSAVAERYKAKWRRERRIRAARRLFLLLVFLGLWEIAGWNVSPILLAPASETLQALATIALDGTLFDAFASSLQALAIGYLAATVMGIAIGLLMGRYRTIENLLDIYVTTALAAPMAALIPVVIIFFGLSLTARIVVVMLFVFPYVLVNTVAGVKSIRPELLEMARAFMLTEAQFFRWILLPNAGPLIMAGLRLGLARSISGMLLAELLILAVGVGGLLVHYAERFDTAELLATVVAIVIVAVIAGSLLQALDRRINRWQPTS